MNDGLEFNNY